jgi:hypothetical protein
MTWRVSMTVSDRIFASLPYLLPLIDGIGFGSNLFRQFPALGIAFSPLIPLVLIYNSIPFIGFIIFLALFLLVIRNENISHFIRFNTMQAILLDIVIFLFSLVLRILMPVPGASFAIETLTNTLFLGIVAAVVYSVAQSLLGRYAEIPAISDAVRMQVP